MTGYRGVTAAKGAKGGAGQMAIAGSGAKKEGKEEICGSVAGD
jgi:hypothetical protein